MQQVVGKELWFMCAMWMALIIPLSYCTSETPQASSEKSTADDCGEIGPPLWPGDVTVPRPIGEGSCKPPRLMEDEGMANDDLSFLIEMRDRLNAAIANNDDAGFEHVQQMIDDWIDELRERH